MKHPQRVKPRRAAAPAPAPPSSWLDALLWPFLQAWLFIQGMLCGFHYAVFHGRQPYPAEVKSWATGFVRCRCHRNSPPSTTRRR